MKLPKEIVKSLFTQKRWIHVTDGAQTDSGISIAIMLDGGPVVKGYTDPNRKALGRGHIPF